VLEVDVNGAIVFCNPGTIATLQRLGVEPDARLFLPADLPVIIRDLEQRRMIVARREVEIKSAIFAESIYLAPGFGTIRIFAGDSTERKRMEEELRQFNAELQARNTELDAFAHTVAHDIKNPLHLVMGYAAELAESHTRLSTDSVAESLQIILRNADKINSITDDLLLLSEARQKDVTVEPLDMAAIVTEARLRLVDMITDQTEIIAPDPSEWPIALGYRLWVEQVWVNYLSNALKYGGQPPRIELGGERLTDGMVRFWVRDNGTGIAPKDQVQLFTTFYRVPHVRGGGHGLGLSIVKRIVEKLGGEVSVESSGVPGEGSVFSFSLPAA
jgi:two-component system sensor histidine kinase/response regulator